MKMKKITPEKLEKLSDEKFAELKQGALLKAGFQLMSINDREPGEARVDARMGVTLPGSDLHMISAEHWRRIMARNGSVPDQEISSAHDPGIGSGITFTSPEFEAAEAAMRAENKSWDGPIEAAQGEIELLRLAVHEREDRAVADGKRAYHARDLHRKLEDARAALDELKHDRAEAMAPLEILYDVEMRAAARIKYKELLVPYEATIKELQAVCALVAITRLSQFTAFANLAAVARAAGQSPTDVRPTAMLDGVIAAWGSPAKLIAETEKLQSRSFA